MFLNKTAIEKILEDGRFFQDSNIRIDSWRDEFVIELLKWYDEKVRMIRTSKKKANNYNEWKQYYEQVVRILYHVVVKLNIRDNLSLGNIFRYFFEVDDSPYRADPDIISAEKLLNIYFFIVEKLSGKPYKKYKVYDEIHPFVGRWDNVIMRDLADHLMINYVCENGKILYCTPIYRDDDEDEQYIDPKMSEEEDEEDDPEEPIEVVLERTVNKFVSDILDILKKRKLLE